MKLKSGEFFHLLGKEKKTISANFLNQEFAIPPPFLKFGKNGEENWQHLVGYFDGAFQLDLTFKSPRLRQEMGKSGRDSLARVC